MIALTEKGEVFSWSWEDGDDPPSLPTRIIPLHSKNKQLHEEVIDVAGGSEYVIALCKNNSVRMLIN